MNTRVASGLLLEDREIDRTVVLGIGMALALIALAVALGGEILRFFDPLSLMIVLGGSLGATLTSFSVHDLGYAWQSFRSVFFTKVFYPLERANYLIELAQAVKRNGLLVLDEEANRVEDPFLRLALQITVDGQSQEDTKRILENEMRTSQEKAYRAVQVFETLASYAPAMGLIGTLIGLIQMMGTLNDPERVGPAMALALVATLYGAMLANLVFMPVAGKLKNRSEEALLVKNITLEGVLSLAKQENALILEQKLLSFLPLIANKEQ